MQNRIENIRQQEENLDKLTSFIEKMNRLTEEWENILPDYFQLIEYYESQQWLEDYDLSNEGKLADIKSGVLSQDAVYNMISEHRNLSIKLMKSALRVIE